MAINWVPPFLLLLKVQMPDGASLNRMKWNREENGEQEQTKKQVKN